MKGIIHAINVILPVNHVMKAKITIVFNVQMDIYKTLAHKLKILKNAEIIVLQELLKALRLVRNVIRRVSCAMAGMIIIVMNARRGIWRI